MELSVYASRLHVDRPTSTYSRTSPKAKELEGSLETTVGRNLVANQVDALDTVDSRIAGGEGISRLDHG